MNLNALPFIDHIFTVLSMPQVAILHISDGWKSYSKKYKVTWASKQMSKLRLSPKFGNLSSERSDILLDA
jgi:hypothetical protein